MKLRLALLGLGVSAIGFGQVVQASGAYSLRVKWSKGQTLRYALTGAGLGAASTISMKSGMTMRVLEVAKGVAKVQVDQDAVLLGGKPMEPARKLTGMLDARMRPAGEESVGSFDGMYPERPVKIGQSWRAPLKLGMASGGIRGIVATYTLRKIATIDGIRVAVLDTKLGGAFEGTGLTTIRVADGTPQFIQLDIGGVMATTKDPKPVKFRFGIVRK